MDLPLKGPFSMVSNTPRKHKVPHSIIVQSLSLQHRLTNKGALQPNVAMKLVKVLKEVMLSFVGRTQFASKSVSVAQNHGSPYTPSELLMS